jgi:hypothetical protein
MFLSLHFSLQANGHKPAQRLNNETAQKVKNPQDGGQTQKLQQKVSNSGKAQNVKMGISSVQREENKNANTLVEETSVGSDTGSYSTDDVGSHHGKFINSN